MTCFGSIVFEYHRRPGNEPFCLVRQPHTPFLEPASPRHPHVTHIPYTLVLNWLVEVAGETKCDYNCLFYAKNYFDRYLEVASVPVTLESIQKIGIACLWIASKFHDELPLSCEYASYMTDHTYSVEELADAEKHILAALDYRLYIMTPATATEVYLCRFRDWVQSCEPTTFVDTDETPPPPAKRTRTLAPPPFPSDILNKAEKYGGLAFQLLQVTTCYFNSLCLTSYHFAFVDPRDSAIASLIMSWFLLAGACNRHLVLYCLGVAAETTTEESPLSLSEAVQQACEQLYTMHEKQGGNNGVRAVYERFKGRAFYQVALRNFEISRQDLAEWFTEPTFDNERQ